jgi:RND superfamily putative drug exporter
VTFRAAPGSSAENHAIDAVRTAIGAVSGATAYLGGSSAETLDGNRAVSRDFHVAAPLILLIVVLVLGALLQSVLAPLLLLGTVLGTYGASLGLSWFVFRHVLHFPALDPSVLLFGFLFLVALGVDYNIFLVSRARDEARTSSARDGMLTSLVATGGVITSAGILLAAVFAVLGVLPLIALTQVGIVVCIGVLLDTLLVRTVLVPALAFVLGERFYWPARLQRTESLD